MKIQLSAIFKFLLVFVFVTSLTACGGKQDTSEKSSYLLFSSSLNSLTETSSNTSVYAVLTAKVLDETGRPLRFANIRFEASLGRLEKTTAETDIDGKVTLKFYPHNDSGEATISAFVNGLQKVLKIQLYQEDGSGNDISFLEISSPNTTVVAGSTNRIKLTASVKDSNGLAIRNKLIRFSTSKGTLHSNLTNVVSAQTATTDSNGEAVLYLHASTQTGTAQVSVFAEGFSDSTNIQIVAGEADSAQSSINLLPATIPADGTTTTQVQVILQDVYGNTVIDGTSVTLESVLGTITSTNPQNTSLGRATFTVQSSNLAGSGAITIAGINNLSTTLTQVIPNNEVKSLGLTSANSQLEADGISLVKITALVAGVSNESVSFSTNNGLLLSDLNGTTSGTTLVANTDANGEAVLFLRSGTQATTAKVSAFVQGFNASVDVDFIAGDVDANNSSMTFTPSTIPADGTSTSIVEVLLLDVNNNVVVDDTEVTLEATAGTVISANPAKTKLGRARFTLRSGNNAENVTVSVFEYSGVTGQVEFGSPTTGEPFQISVTPESNHLFVKGVGKKDSISLAIEVRDSAGNLISDADTGVNNLKVSFNISPQSGEELVGSTANGQVVNHASEIEVRTLDGSTSVSLTSGTRPGVIGLRIEALNSAGQSITPPVVANLSEISIASGPPHNIAVSYPVVGAIENLGNGVYRRVGSLSVTDQYGNAVPDGTVINLGYLDSVIVSNFSTTVNAVVGAALISVGPPANPVLTDLVNNGLDSAAITRNSTSRTILANDRVLIFNAQANDKSRFVSSVSNNALTTNRNYNHTQTNARYLVGSALLGGQVLGVDITDEDKIKTGFATTESGIATFYITYPADSQTILTGCYGDPTIDTRALPAGSAQTWLIAESNETGAATLDNRGCFAAIADYKLTKSGSSSISATSTVIYSLEDANEIPLPFVFLDVGVSYTVNVGGLIVTVGNCIGRADRRTSTAGTCSLPITVQGGVSGDAATVTVSGGGESSSLTVTIP